MDHGVGLDIPPFITASKKNIYIDSIKKAEDSDDVIVRMHEGHGDTTDAHVILGFKPMGVSECDLMEQPLKPLKLSKGKLQLRFKPFEIKTLTFALRAGKRK